MLYIGHFSFDELDRDQKQRHGYFTCVVNSTDVEHSVEEFKSLIERMKVKKQTFQPEFSKFISKISSRFKRFLKRR